MEKEIKEEEAFATFSKGSSPNFITLLLKTNLYEEFIKNEISGFHKLIGNKFRSE